MSKSECEREFSSKKQQPFNIICVYKLCTRSCILVFYFILFHFNAHKILSKSARASTQLSEATIETYITINEQIYTWSNCCWRIVFLNTLLMTWNFQIRFEKSLLANKINNNNNNNNNKWQNNHHFTFEKFFIRIQLFISCRSFVISDRNT